MSSDTSPTEGELCGRTRRGRPPQMDTSAREAAILRATAQLLLEVPFDDVTMAAIASRTGMSKRTVYAHFKSREELLVRAIVDISRTIFLPLSAEDLQRPLRDRLSLLLRINAPPGSEATKLEFLRSIIAKAQTYPVLAQQLYANGRGALMGYVSAELSRAVEAREIMLDPKEVDLAADMLLDMTFENILFPLLHPSDPRLDDAAVARRRELAITIFLRGCAP